MDLWHGGCPGPTMFTFSFSHQNVLCVSLNLLKKKIFCVHFLLQQLLLWPWPASQALHQPALVAALPPLISPHHRSVFIISVLFPCFSLFLRLYLINEAVFLCELKEANQVNTCLAFPQCFPFYSFFCASFLCLSATFCLCVPAAVSRWGSAFACQSSGLPYPRSHWFSPQGLVWRGQQQQELLLWHRWLCHGPCSLYQ